MRNIIRLGIAAATLCLQTAAADDVVGQWTLWNFSRTCQDAVTPPLDWSRCAYGFNISEQGSDVPAATLTPCTVWAYSVDVPAAQIEWSSYPCREAGLNSTYIVSNGYDERGFITVTIKDVLKGQYAFFGYNNAEIADRKEVVNKTEPAYKIEAPVKRDVSVEAVASKRDEGCDPKRWVVNNLYREAHSMSQIAVISFDLERCDGTGTHCEFSTLGLNSTTVDIKYDDFSDAPCRASDEIRVSWGYKADTDGAVMTVVDLAQHRRAFLGWDDVNASKRFKAASARSERY